MVDLTDGGRLLQEQAFHNTPQERKDLKRLVAAGVDITRPLEEQGPEAQAAYARFELEELARAQKSLAPVIRVRVKGAVKVIDALWVTVELRMQLGPDREWLRLTHKDRPLLVARRFTSTHHEGDSTGEVQELYVISSLKHTLQSGAARVLSLTNRVEGTDADGRTVWSYHALLGSRLTVAVDTRSDGTVALVGLA